MCFTGDSMRFCCFEDVGQDVTGRGPIPRDIRRRQRSLRLIALMLYFAMMKVRKYQYSTALPP